MAMKAQHSGISSEMALLGVTEAFRGTKRGNTVEGSFDVRELSKVEDIAEESSLDRVSNHSTENHSYGIYETAAGSAMA